MKRRAFVTVLATAPWWIRRAFADASVGGAPAASSPGRRRLPVARPTLVLVVPRDPDARRDRGVAFGELLNDGGDAELAPLDGLDLVCAPAAEFGVAGDPLMVYVDGARVVPLDARLPRPDGRRDDDAAATVARERIVRLGRLVRQALPMAGERDVPAAAARVRRRWLDHAPPGARWGRFTGCGVAFADEPTYTKCGMGHVPQLGARFLDFYVGRA